jgi:Ig-like domain from next to BRCA1 gene
MSKRSRRRKVSAAGPARQSSSKTKEHHFQIVVVIISGVFVIAAAVVGAWAIGLFGSQGTPTSSPSSSPVGPLVSGDVSEFIRDVTFPDHSKVRINDHFTKIWELKDDGDVKWTGRYLAALGPSSGGCKYPRRVKIPNTDPGKLVNIRVSVTASASPGMCFVTWKMVTPAGVFTSLMIPEDFPNDTGGIWFKVNVIDAKVSG